jgi:hypothetical protein
LARDAEMIPLPSEEVTPPVTKMYLMFSDMTRVQCAKVHLRDTKVGYLRPWLFILCRKCWKFALILLLQRSSEAFNDFVF